MATQWLPVASLLPADSPRLDGEDVEHIRMLAAVDTKLPPIIVHRQSMRVIDGMHRLGAAVMRGDDMIEVRFFDGPEDEAFVLAVTANVTHGRPLSTADRTTAAERIIASHPTWSDRAIAAAAGLGARSVADIRRRLDNALDTGHSAKARVGRDGRVRPLDHAEGRRRASEIIRDRPDASLRDIARNAGVSPATALDVRNRIQRGDEPVPPVRQPSRRRNDDIASSDGVGVQNRQPKRDPIPEPDVTSILRGLTSDPSLRFTESGRNLLRWMLSRAIRPGEWHDISAEIPPHSTYIMANVARQCADQWQRIADDLQRRAR